jgi:hypothetical protein
MRGISLWMLLTVQCSGARSTGDPGIFYKKIIEIFVTVKDKEIITEGPGGGKGYRGLTARSAVKASTLRREAPLREPGVPPSLPYCKIFFNSTICSSLNFSGNSTSSSIIKLPVAPSLVIPKFGIIFLKPG